LLTQPHLIFLEKVCMLWIIRGHHACGRRQDVRNFFFFCFFFKLALLRHIQQGHRAMRDIWRQGCQMFYFQAKKIPIWTNFWGP
jgi:hypothetical protein